ncbi:hypothetical protein SAICODRAFT_31548 [Saitoella complicata NRRL Y-17804]|uniref:uncharacterized protein n=1 Tax=Saitoella complicata (strain BCRC 22490 / CBS 7301 / JCM 7358 / NBRC 10748 / NRRL Y-17804) TaxID=698492 RepID=UPI000867CDDB|nr:uncharacterized protein SAICODRAFT_31548 [Saitoella complicata NRRL Y-17804]ODQ51041.1 hypothetical protein SAICODRAFT_31548 [Saitoella complicata NRRL Y-17804]
MPRQQQKKYHSFSPYHSRRQIPTSHSPRHSQQHWKHSAPRSPQLSHSTPLPYSNFRQQATQHCLYCRTCCNQDKP